MEELPALLLFAVVSLLVVSLFWKELKIFTFDPQYAQSQGFSPGILHFLLNLSIILGVVIGIQTVGVILMVALLIAPGSAARQWTHRLSTMVLLAGGFGILSGIGGVLLSDLGAGLPPGPVVVLLSFFFVIGSIALGPKNREGKRENLPSSPGGKK